MKRVVVCLVVIMLLALPASGGLESREHLRRGIELARQGLHDGAVAELTRSLALDPNDADAHFHLGRSLVEIAVRGRGSLKEAIAALEEALRLDPSRDYVRMNLAELYGMRLAGTFQPDRMIALFEDLLTRLPDRIDIRLRFAQTLIRGEVRLSRTGHPERVLQDSAWTMDLARFHLEKVLDQASRDADAAIEARTLLGEIQFRMGEWDASRATFDYLITSYPERGLNLAPAWNTVGHCQWRMKRWPQAIEAFRRGVDLAPTNNIYLYDLMLAYEKAGGYPTDLPKRYRFPRREEKIDPAAPPLLRFTDIAASVHVNKLAGAGPAGWADYDGDGRVDLVACGCDTFCTLFHNEGDRFTDATLTAKLGRLEPGFGSVWGDYDNDADPDLFIARNGWNGPAPDSLLRNNGDGTFLDVGVAAGVADPGSSFHAAWFDYDRDGWLDLVVSNGVYLEGSTNQLYRNLRDGTFANVTVAAGLAEPSVGYGTIGVALGDYDDDGWPDIFYHGRMGPNRLYRNRRNGTFEEVAAAAGVAGTGTQNGYIALLVDLDSDGDLDIFTGSLATWDQVVGGYRTDYRLGALDDLPRLYRNRGDGTFTDDSLAAGFRYPIGIMAGSSADLDNDGYQDIYLGTGNPEVRRLEPNILYWNRGGKSFEDVTRYSGTGSLGKGHGVVFFDWDLDGDLEIFAELGGFFHGDWWESALYRNDQGNRNGWLSVRLRQQQLNRDAVGARVTVVAGGLRQAQEVTAGRGFGSSDPPILHFGLGRAAKAERVEIRWPDGARQVLTGVRSGQRLVVERTLP